MSYTLTFLFAITLNLFEIIDAAQICVDFRSIGRVCVPDPASEINSDFRFSSIGDCPVGKISIRGSCVDIEEAFEITSEFGTDIFKNMKENQCSYGQIILNGQCINERERGDSFGDGVAFVPCPQDSYADKDGICRPKSIGSPTYGGGIASAPCPQGTRADQHGNCRQELV